MGGEGVKCVEQGMELVGVGFLTAFPSRMPRWSHGCISRECPKAGPRRKHCESEFLTPNGRGRDQDARDTRTRMRLKTAWAGAVSQGERWWYLRRWVGMAQTERVGAGGTTDG